MPSAQSSVQSQGGECTLMVWLHNIKSSTVTGQAPSGEKPSQIAPSPSRDETNEIGDAASRRQASATVGVDCRAIFACCDEDTFALSSVWKGGKRLTGFPAIVPSRADLESRLACAFSLQCVKLQIPKGLVTAARVLEPVCCNCSLREAHRLESIESRDESRRTVERVAPSPKFTGAPSTWFRSRRCRPISGCSEHLTAQLLPSTCDALHYWQAAELRTLDLSANGMHGFAGTHETERCRRARTVQRA